MTTTLEIDTTPRAWVGCLGCYNGGALVGKWLDGETCADLEAAGLADSAGKCNRCGADEFWVMDHENYLGALSGECSPSEAQEIAETLASVEEYERDILAAWLSLGNELDLDTMRDKYYGQHESDEDMARDYAENCGLFSNFKDNERDFIERYFDYEAYGRDLAHDLTECDGYYFWAY